MSILTDILISIASGLLSTTYGHGELFCGDVGKPVPCSVGAVTASGETFHPTTVPSAAVAAPFKVRLDARWIRLKLAGPFPCKRVRLNDKMHARYVGVRGFDLSPSAVRLLTNRPASSYWSGIVEVCR